MNELETIDQTYGFWEALIKDEWNKHEPTTLNDKENENGNHKSEQSKGNMRDVQTSDSETFLQPDDLAL